MVTDCGARLLLLALLCDPPPPAPQLAPNPWEVRAESWGMLPCWLRRGVPPCCEPEHGGATGQRVVVSLWVWSRR